MKTFIINLGLGNSPYEQIADKDDRHISALIMTCRIADKHDVSITHEWAEGEYEGKPEETMVITVTAKSVDVAHEFATDLVKQFTQQCVALYDVDGLRGTLVWSNEVDDRPYTFDPAFFIMPKAQVN